MNDITLYIHNLLTERKLTLGIAESCTGGLLSSSLTKQPGSSRYLLLAVVAYSNSSKVSILKIPVDIINKEGAVSEKVAILMSKGIRKISKADLGIGITGIAGPTGSTPLKPKGTVFIAVSDNRKTLCKKFVFKGSRRKVISQAVLNSLKLLGSFIIGK